MSHSSTHITRRQLGAIHQLKRDLDLCEGAYRNILHLLVNKRSAKHLTKAEASEVISFFIGSKPKPKPAPVSDAEALDILGAA